MNTNGDPAMKSGRQSGRRKLQRILEQVRQRPLVSSMAVAPPG